jgi:hypothetical protein
MEAGGEKFEFKAPFSVSDLYAVLVGSGVGPVFYRTFLTDSDKDDALTEETAATLSLCAELASSSPMYSDALFLFTRKFFDIWRTEFKDIVAGKSAADVRVAIADRIWLSTSTSRYKSGWVDLRSGLTIPELPEKPVSILAVNGKAMLARLARQIEATREQPQSTQSGVQQP